MGGAGPVKLGRIAAMGLSFLASAAQGGDGLVYRYRNAEGVPVVSDSLPPEAAGAGYEVLAADGTVLQVVPPAPKEHDPQARAAEEARAAEDRYLLRSFSSVEEVRAAGERRLAALDREIATLERTREELQRRKSRLARQAAGYQAIGRAVPEAIAAALEELALALADAERLLAARRAERASEAQRFARYAARFADLSVSRAEEKAPAP